jgi:peptidoglycan/LPS O-acetylase OafA/YrhL
VSDGKLCRSGSILLDLVRFGAACTVLLSHFGHAGISVGFPDYTAAGHLAVAVFFVLSGFVIRFVTVTREASAKEYLIDRVSRIYSVVIPALAITVLCEIAAGSLSRDGALVSAALPWRQLPLQLGANLTFQAQDWGYEINPLSNDVFWSLSFECLYYAIYGLLFYRVQGRQPLCFLLLLLAGPSIALMFPVWLIGCLTFDMYQRFRKSRIGVYVSSFVFAGILCVLFTARAQIRNFAAVTDEAHRTAWLSRLLVQLPHHELVFASGRVPWLARASASFVGVGLITAVFMTWALLLLERLNLEVSARIARWIRFVADSTFALYLLHLPLLILIVSVLGKPIHGWWLSVLTLGLIIFACVGLALPMDAFKRKLRLGMEQLRTPDNEGHVVLKTRPAKRRIRGKV